MALYQWPPISIAAPVGGATEAKQDTQITRLNLLATEATLAAASAKLPATLGQKTMANSMAVTVASDQVIETRGGILEVAGSAAALNADGIASTDVSKFKTISLQITGTYVGVISFQGSNNNSDWVSINGQVANSASVVPAQTTTSGATGIYVIPVAFEFFRARMTTYTSGTATCTAICMSEGAVDQGSRQVSATQSGTWNVNATPQIPGVLTVKQARVSLPTAGTAVRATTDGAVVSATRRFLSISIDPDDLTLDARFWIGSSSVTNTGANKGQRIFPGQPFVRENCLNDYYIVSDQASQFFTIVEEE